MFLKTFFSTVTFLCLTTFSVIAQTQVIQAKQYLDVNSGKMVSPATLVIESGKIQSINPVTLPTNAEVIDWGELTIVPGYIDAHVHLSNELTRDMQLRTVTESSTDRALRGAQYARKTLMAGFTTVRDLASDGYVNIALANASDEGWIDAPHIVPAGYALSITGGHGDAGGFAPGLLDGDYRHGIADGPEEVKKSVRYQIKQGAKVIKVFATAGVLSFEESVGAQHYTAEELTAAVEEAARHDMKVAAHAHGTEGIIAAIKAGVASIEHGSILNDEAIQLMIEHGTYLVPTTHIAEALDLEMLPPLLKDKGARVIPQMVESLERAISAGVKVAFGTDAGVIPHGTNAKEFATLVKRGMSPLEAIRSATLNAADLLDIKDRGAITTGFLADLVALSGNPLNDVTELETPVHVMKVGKVYTNK